MRLPSVCSRVADDAALSFLIDAHDDAGVHISCRGSVVRGHDNAGERFGPVRSNVTMESSLAGEEVESREAVHVELAAPAFRNGDVTAGAIGPAFVHRPKL